MKLFLTFSFILASLFLSAQKEMTTEEIMGKVSKGKQYTLVILKSGKPLAQEDQQLQMEHLKNLFRMEREGIISIFGPVMQDSAMEGIIVFNTTNRENIKAELLKDPFVKNGHLVYEMHNWFSIPGQKLPEQ